MSTWLSGNHRACYTEECFMWFCPCSGFILVSVQECVWLWACVEIVCNCQNNDSTTQFLAVMQWTESITMTNPESVVSHRVCAHTHQHITVILQLSLFEPAVLIALLWKLLLRVCHGFSPLLLSLTADKAILGFCCWGQNWTLLFEAFGNWGEGIY